MYKTLQEMLSEGHLENMLAAEIANQTETNQKDVNDNERMNEKVALVDKLILSKKLDKKLFRSMPRSYELKKVDEKFHEWLGVSFDNLHILNYAIVTQNFFNENFRKLESAGMIRWSNYDSDKMVDIDAWRISNTDTIYCVYNIPNTKKKVIFSDERELDLSKLH